jgi:hypothetical protein
MKCQIQWVNKQGNPTPDENEAVAIAHFHKPIWALPGGGPGNHIVGYSEEIEREFLICQEHLDAVGPDFKAWSFSPIKKD